MLATSTERYDTKIISFQERETDWTFTSCPVPHDCINTIYQFIKPFLDNKLSIFEDYGVFKFCLKFSCVLSTLLSASAYHPPSYEILSGQSQFSINTVELQWAHICGTMEIC